MNLKVYERRVAKHGVVRVIDIPSELMVRGDAKAAIQFDPSSGRLVITIDDVVLLEKK